MFNPHNTCLHDEENKTQSLKIEQFIYFFWYLKIQFKNICDRNIVQNRETFKQFNNKQ